MRFRDHLLTVLAVCFLASCSAKTGGGPSTVTFQVPTVAQLNSVGSFNSLSKDQSAFTVPSVVTDFAWDRACFMANITASDIVQTSASTCQIPTGIFGGSVAPGGTLSLKDVPQGPGRKVEVFAYFRRSTTESCATAAAVSAFNLSRTSLIGSATGITIAKENESVDVSISLPTQNVIAQLSLPPSCDASADRPFRSLSGAFTEQATSLTGFRVKARVGVSADKVQTLTPNGFKVSRRRGTNP